MLLDVDEYYLMNKLKHGGIIPKGYNSVAQHLASLGLMRLGYIRRDGRFYETGIPTYIGKRMFKFDRMERSWWRSFIYNVTAPLI